MNKFCGFLKICEIQAILYAMKTELSAVLHSLIQEGLKILIIHCKIFCY